jgi:hypothetical protein
MDIWRYLRNLILALFALILVGAPLAACSGSDTTTDQNIRPAAVQTASGDYCTPWMNQPGEADGSGYRACDMPIPQDRPVRDSGMSDADWFMAGVLWQNAMGHSNFYYGPNYYDQYIGPAWYRHPGYSGYGWGHRPITRIDARTYNTTVITHVNKTYAADEKRAAANPKYSTYKGSGGRTYTGNNVPKSAFKSSNVPVTGPAGNSPTSNSPAVKRTPTSPTTRVNQPGVSGSGGRSGSAGYGSGSGGRSSTPSGSAGRSSGGHH